MESGEPAEEKRKMKFYVIEKSNWQGDNWSPVAGDFPSRGEAQKVADGLAVHDGDIKSESHTRVVSRSSLRTKYGWNNDHDLSEELWSCYLHKLQAENPDKQIWNDGTIH